MRLKNRNRTFPTTEELPSAKEQSSLAEASPLASPWVTPNTDLPIDHDKPTKSDSVGGGDTSLDTTVDQRTIGNGGLIRQTLPPINSMLVFHFHNDLLKNILFLLLNNYIIIALPTLKYNQSLYMYYRY